ncbi:class I SAM-dependent methyltransferase [Anthocerotibacter panamensis]|uniref:class I SAM-dependent methyltransferase n=1 Tax=Anthocerotibacter panamensis TaxID=2857077 RepID=UPI001C4047B0|nr:class I SAM-dependent methyltransferase [Anthocerotibacter panamensis]
MTEEWYTQSLEQKKGWYGNAAQAYNWARPRYPEALISHAITLAQLPPGAKCLELGCGPGVATVAFARRGFALVGLEPNPQLCQLAQENCVPYPLVTIRNTSFEEWELEPETFHAVLSATSFHWVSAEVRYHKTAAALQPQGLLILLWNMWVQPAYEVVQALGEVYKVHAPTLGQYVESKIQEDFLQEFSRTIPGSKLFKDLITEQILCEDTYTSERYLALLSTYSGYLALEASARQALFDGLREVLERAYGGNISVSYLSVLQMAYKV